MRMLGGSEQAKEMMQQLELLFDKIQIVNGSKLMVVQLGNALGVVDLYGNTALELTQGVMYENKCLVTPTTRDTVLAYVIKKDTVDKVVRVISIFGDTILYENHLSEYWAIKKKKRNIADDIKVRSILKLVDKQSYCLLTIRDSNSDILLFNSKGIVDIGNEHNIESVESRLSVLENLNGLLTLQNKSTLYITEPFKSNTIAIKKENYMIVVYKNGKIALLDDRTGESNLLTEYRVIDDSYDPNTNYCGIRLLATNGSETHIYSRNLDYMGTIESYFDTIYRSLDGNILAGKRSGLADLGYITFIKNEEYQNFRLDIQNKFCMNDLTDTSRFQRIK